MEDLIKIVDDIMGLSNEAYEEIQSLQVQPTATNVGILNTVMRNLRLGFADCKRLRETLQRAAEEEKARENTREAEGEA